MPNSNENQVDKSALMNSSANGLAAKVLNTLPKNQNPAVKNSNLLLHKSVSIRIFSRNMAYYYLYVIINCIKNNPYSGGWFF